MPDIDNDNLSGHHSEWQAFVERRELSDATDKRQLFMFMAVSGAALILGWSVETWIMLLVWLWLVERLFNKLS